jgi:hypothetical protein
MWNKLVINAVRALLVARYGHRGYRTDRKRKTTKIVFLKQQEPPNFRINAFMHLIMILIRWLVGFLCRVRSDSGFAWRFAPREAGGTHVPCNSIGANRLGVGGMIVGWILANIMWRACSGRRSGSLISSFHLRGGLCVNPQKPDYFVVETPLLCPNFSPSAPLAWG